MKQAFAALLLLTILPGCERYPTGIAPAEQVQALVFTDFAASEVFYRDSAGDDARRLFLCYGKPETDAASRVLAYVSHSFRSVRPYSAAVRSAQTGIYSEPTTGEPGTLLHIAPFSVPASGPLTVTITSSYERGAAGYSYRLELMQGRWRIIDHHRKWIACK